MQYEDEDFIGEGDLVQLIIDSRVSGMVVGSAGSLVYVRLTATIVLPYHVYELRKLASNEPPAKEGDSADVINFTEAVANLKKAKTKGNA